MMNFLKSESGAVTVDWVVLTAGIVGVGALVGSQLTGVVNASTAAIGDDVCKEINSAKPVYNKTSGTCAAS